LIFAAFLSVCLQTPVAAANEMTPSQGGPGQVVEDNSGNMFMEEVVDVDKWNQEEAARKKKSNLERQRLSDKMLMDNGLQVTPSGSLVPLINRGAPPVQQMGTRFTSSFEPIYPAYIVGPGFMPPGPIPYAPPTMPSAMPYTGLPYGNPIIGFPFGNPYTGLPFYSGLPSYSGLPYYAGRPFYSGFNGGFLGGLFNRPFYGAPYMTPYAGYGGYYPSTLVVPPSYSYTWESTPGQPTTPPATFSSSGSVLSRPFWNGYIGNGPFGGLQAGGAFGLPTETQYDSSTTFTPIPPSFSR